MHRLSTFLISYELTKYYFVNIRLLIGYLHVEWLWNTSNIEREYCNIMWNIQTIIFVSLVSLSLELNDGWNAVDELTFDLMEAKNFEVHNTRPFRRQPGLHVRHDLDFKLALKHHKPCDKPFQFSLNDNEKSVFTWTQTPIVHNEDILFHLYVNRSIPIGQYTLNFSDPCSETKGTARPKTAYLGDVNVMFNPWFGQLDENNMRIRRQPSDTMILDEYIYNNYGYIWGDNGVIPWLYAVGSQVVTESRNGLMSLMSPTERSSPVLYSRALMKLINTHVLIGRWDGHYSDGIDPTQWVGSEAILMRWLWTRQPVRYGQCWVFAALLTTLLRASGIPTRTVTNYGSHHDRGLTVDRIAVLRQYDNIVQQDETKWNFHVWSEAWLERPDLLQQADWNALDATPQEPSPLAPGKPYCAGPAYVPYIRANMRTASYDTYFVLAEVNAVEVCPVTGRILRQAVGYAVVTKKPGMQRNVYNYNNPEYVTSNYKFSSSSKRDSESTNPPLPPPDTGCERDGGMRLNSTPVSPRVGENFVITVTEVSVPIESIVLRMELRNYMGESLGIIDTYTGVSEINVTESEYLPYLQNSSIFRFTVGVNNESAAGGFEFHDALRIRLLYDQLLVETVKDPNSDTISLTLTYTNPLSVPMTGVMVSVSSPNDTYMRMEQADIPARTHFMLTVEVQCGDNDDADVMIPISLDSDETQSVYGAGWTSCSDNIMDGPTNGGSVVLPGGISGFLLSFLALLLL